MSRLVAAHGFSRERMARVLLFLGFAASMLALRRIWYGAAGGATLPLRTSQLAAAGVAALVAGSALARRREAGEWKLFLARLVLVSASLGISLLGAEIAVRVFFEWRLGDNSIERLREYEAGKNVSIVSTHPLAAIVRLSADSKLVFELRPNLDLDFGHRRVRTNRAGMRQDSDYGYERAPNSVRILGLGDSGMFGWNVDQSEDYLSVLESNLRQSGNGVLYEVLNLSVPGYNTQLEVEALGKKGRKYRPDVVVVGWCENDFGLPFFVTQKRRLLRTDVSYLKAWLFEPNDLVRLIGDDVRDQRSWDREQVSDSLVEGSGPAGVREALSFLEEMAREDGFRVLLFGPLRDEIRKIAADVGIDFYDTNEKIPAGKYPPEFAVHFMHPRPEGHRVLAEHLEQALERRGWLAPTERLKRPPP